MQTSHRTAWLCTNCHSARFCPLRTLLHTLLRTPLRTLLRTLLHTLLHTTPTCDDAVEDLRSVGVLRRQLDRPHQIVVNGGW